MIESERKQETARNKEIESIHLGTGYLSWPTVERVYDRYGAVTLFATASSKQDSDATTFHNIPAGSFGRLVAEIIETQESYHIGDLARGIFPQTPEIGEILILGEGILFLERSSRVVGLKPLVARSHDWLKPEVLYRLHGQKVHLFFEELQNPTVEVFKN